MQAMLGAFPCISMCLACVADMVPPQHRAATFGFAMASFSSGVVAGPLAGGLLSPLAAAWVGAGGVLFNVLYTIIFVKESLPAAARKQVHTFPFIWPACHPHAPCLMIRLAGCCH